MRIEKAVFVALALAVASPAPAQSTDHAAHHTIAQAGATAMAQGEVRKVDKSSAKITLKHGAIPNLDMDAMTMVFQVRDKALLDKVKAGDKVRFSADKIGGQLTVTAIEPDR